MPGWLVKKPAIGGGLSLGGKRRESRDDRKLRTSRPGRLWLFTHSAAATGDRGATQRKAPQNGFAGAGQRLSGRPAPPFLDLARVPCGLFEPPSGARPCRCAQSALATVVGGPVLPLKYRLGRSVRRNAQPR